MNLAGAAGPPLHYGAASRAAAVDDAQALGLGRGRHDGFPKVAYAERFVLEVQHTTLIRIPDAGRISLPRTRRTGPPARSPTSSMPGCSNIIRMQRRCRAARKGRQR
jgi:hypothetical protein